MGLPAKLDDKWVNSLSDEEFDQYHKMLLDNDPEYQKMFGALPSAEKPAEISAEKPAEKPVPVQVQTPVQTPVQQPAPKEPPPEKDEGFTMYGRTPGELVKDWAITGAKSVISVGEIVPGLLDIPTGGRVGKAMEDYLGYDPKASKDLLSSHQSEAQKRANDKLSEAEGFWNTVGAAIQNPSTIAHAIAESLPLMYGGAAMGRKGLQVLGKYGPKVWMKASKKLKMALAAGAGEGAVISGLTSSEIRQETEDGLLTFGQSAAAAAAGLLGGAIGFAGGRLAQRLGVKDPDTMLVGLGGDLKQHHIATRIIAGGFTEGVFEELPQEAQEAVWVNAALGRPLMEGVPEAGAMGMLVGGAMGAGVQLKPGRKEKGPPDPRRRVVHQAMQDPDDFSLIYGSATSGMTTTQARTVTRQLNDMENPESREKAVDAIEKAIAKAAATPEEGNRKAKIFAEQALQRIEAGEEIEIDQEMAEYASMDPTERGQYTKDTMLGAMDETVETLQNKINNLQKLKKPTPKQQANLQQFQADLEVLNQSQEALNTWDPAKDALTIQTDTQGEGAETTDILPPGMEDSEAADLYSDAELDAVAGEAEGLTQDDTESLKQYGLTDEEISAADPASSQELLFNIRDKSPEDAAPIIAAWRNPAQDRRKDQERRKSIAEMTPEELRAELLIDPMTGLGNKRAYKEAEKKNVQASIDIDSLKWYNDSLGHDAGDALLEIAGEAFSQTDLRDNTFHPSGDEFIIQGDTQEEVEHAINQANEYLKNNSFDFVDADGNTIVGLKGEFSYGTGETFADADQQMARQKIEREFHGDRSVRGGKPPGIGQDVSRGASGKTKQEIEGTRKEVLSLFHQRVEDLSKIDNPTPQEKTALKNAREWVKETELTDFDYAVAQARMDVLKEAIAQPTDKDPLSVEDTTPETEKEEDPGFVPNPVGANSKGEEIFTYPAQPNKRWIEDKDGNLSGTEALPEQLFKEGKTRFLTDEEIQKFTAEKEATTEQQTPQEKLDAIDKFFGGDNKEGLQKKLDELKQVRDQLWQQTTGEKLKDDPEFLVQIDARIAEIEKSLSTPGQDVSTPGQDVSTEESQAVKTFAGNMARQWEKDTGEPASEARIKDFEQTGKELARQIQERDFQALTDRMHRGNPESLRMFRTLIGKSTQNDAAIKENIRSLDPEKYDAWDKARKDNAAKERADKEAAEAKEAREEMLNRPVNERFSDETWGDWVTRLTEEGYELTEEKRGFATVLSLSKGNNTYSFKTKQEQEYVQEQYDKISSEQLRSDMDEEAKDMLENPDDYITDEQADELFGKTPKPEIITDPETNMQAEIVQLASGEAATLLLGEKAGKYSVAVRDMDSGETIGEARIFDSLEAAREHANTVKSPAAEKQDAKSNPFRVGDIVTPVRDFDVYGKEPLRVVHSQENGIQFETLDGKPKGGHFPYKDFKLSALMGDRDRGGKEATPISAAYDHLKSGKGFKNIVEARKLIGEATGQSFKTGTIEAKQLDEQIEVAAVRVANDIVAEGKSPAETFDALVDLQNRLPNLAVRTSTSMRDQAYSTPLPLAWVASVRAGLTGKHGGEVVFELSAGNGALLIGTSGKDVVFANEINPDRARNLPDTLGTNTSIVTTQDGTNYLPKGRKAGVVIANPPFGTVKDDAGNSKKWKISDNYTTTQIDHAMVFNALDGMMGNGRAVFIIGSVKDQNTEERARMNLYRNPTKVQFFKHLMDNYNVVDLFSVSGKLYSKQGAKWPVDVIVVEGKGKSSMTLPGAKPPPYISTLEELKGKLDGTRNVGLDADGTRGPGDSTVPAGDSDTQGTGADQSGIRSPLGVDNQGSDGTVREPGGSDGTPGVTAGEPGTATGVDGQGQGGAHAGPTDQHAGGRSPGSVGDHGSSTQEGADASQQGSSAADTGTGQQHLGGQPPVSIEDEIRNISDEDFDSMLDEVFGDEITVPQDVSDELQNMSEDEVDSLIDDVFEAPTKTKIPDEKPDKGRRSTDVGLQSTRAKNEEAIERYLKNWARREARKNKPPKRPPKNPPKNPPKDPKDLLDDATLHASEGVQDALKGLGALFTPRNTLSSGFIFNAETYKAAKPYFLKAWNEFKAAKRSLKELLIYLGSQFGAEIRPYLKKFKDDVVAMLEKEDKKPPKQPKQEKADPETQVPYVPASKSTAIGTLMPKNMAESINKALKAVQEQHGDIDKYVANQLGYTVEEVIGKDGQFGYFSAEQVDAIALALNNISVGSGFIIGDQTGVGKGRVVAAMIRYAMRHDMVPVFVTHKAYLYADMYRDLSDIGMADIADRILMTNSNEKIPMRDDGSVVLKTKADHLQNLRQMTSEGEVSKDYDVVFTTYTQMDRTGSARRVFLETITQGRGMLIMDEAHNAGGTAGDRIDPNTGKVPRSIWFRELIQNAHSTFYSSATYAKRPDTMSLYSRTDMRLAVDDINDLAHAIGQGGVPLQQVTATMLAEAGQYVRRERSFDGVDYNTETVEVDQQKAAAMSVSFADIKKFNDDFIGDALDGISDTGAAGGTTVGGGSSASDRHIHSSGFTSVMHNLIGQTLLALKVPAAVDLAIKQFQETGKKPIIALANTMGSFIEEHAIANNLRPGDGIDLTFNHLIANYLDKTRRYTERTGPGQPPIVHYITDEELGPAGVAEFNRVKAMIGRLDFSNVPISPVDYALSKFKEAGISAGEITGREHTIEYRPDGTTTYQRRGSKEKSNQAKVDLMRDFNSDKVNAMILNQSGSTGLSLHALPKWEGHDPAERVMILVQTEANIDTHMQMLGRIHRAGQVKTPAYIQLSGNIPTETRGAAVLAGKMASLNANTTAAKGSKLEAEGVVDFINRYGNRVVANIMGDFPEIHQALGSPLAQSDTTASGLSEMGAAGKVTGRIPLLRTIKEQTDLYNMILSEYNDLIDQLDAMGQNDLEAKSFDTDARTISRAVVFEGRGQSPFTKEAVSEVVDMKKIGRSYNAKEVVNLLKQHVLGMDSTAAKREERSMLEIMAAAEANQEVVQANMRDAFTAHLNEQMEDVENEDLRAGVYARLSTTAHHWQEIFEVAIPGTVWEFPLGDTYFPMVVLNVQQKGTPKNPLALGTWRVTFAVPDSARRFETSFAAINSLRRTEAQLMDGNRGYATEADLARFDRARSTAREDRTIMTGNLLAAYARYSRGRIINFTDNNGKIRQGILMPQTFNTQEAFEAQRVVLDNVDSIMTVLDEGVAVKSRRGDLIIGNVMRGSLRDLDNFSISVPGSRIRGGVYFLNQGLENAMGVPFVQRGNRQIATVPKRRMRGVFQHMLDNMNELFENASDNQRVRTALGMGDLTVEQVGESSTTPEDGQTQFSTNADYTPGQGVSLKDIQKEFKGQQVLLTPDGHIAVVMKNGMVLSIRRVDFDGKATRAAIRSGRMGEGGSVLGAYEDLNIDLNKDLADILTLHHELWHFLEENLLTRSERMLFQNKARAYEKAGKFMFEWRSDMMENSANAFAQFLNEREQHRGTPLGKIIQKILDFFDALRNIAKMSERKLAREMESGKMFGRTPRQGRGQSAGMQYEQAAAAFYSKMRDVLKKKLNKGPGKMVKAQVKAWADNGEFKAAELEWSGLLDWLEEQKTVTKKDVLDYLDRNKVDIQVLELEKEEPGFVEMIIDEDTDEVGFMAIGHDGLVIDTFDSEEEAYDALWDFESSDETGPQADYSEYQEPGGRSYKVMQFTLPESRSLPDGFSVIQNPSSAANAKKFIVVDEKGERYGSGDTEQQAVKAFVGHGHTGAYTSSHFPGTPNVVVHVRMNDRTGPNGTKVLFLEEVQSDWHQDGRKKGYKKNRKIDTTGWAVKTTDENKFLGQRQIEIYDETGSRVSMRSGFRGTDAEAIAQAAATKSGLQDHGKVPNAPFKDSKAWAMLVMKRMVRHAVENNYDAVYWTDGETQYNRWGSEVFAWNKQTDQRGKTFWKMTGQEQQGGDAFAGMEAELAQKAIATGSRVDTKEDVRQLVEKTMSRQSSEWAPKKWNQHLDKLTDSIWDRMQTDDSGTTLPRKQGMEGFYDKILPAEVNKFFNKKSWGKAKAGRIDFEVNRDAAKLTWDERKRHEQDDTHPKMTAWALHITPQMRSKALREGMPLFAAAPGINSKAFKSWFKKSIVVDENGNPMVVYHGTLKDFNIFASGYDGKIATNIGTHFAKDASVTAAFSMGNYTIASSDNVDIWNPDNSWYRDNDGTIRYDGVVVVQNQMENKVEIHNPENHGPLSKLKPGWSSRVAKPGGRVHPVYLSIQNPLVVDNDPQYTMDDHEVGLAIAKVVLPMDKELFVELAMEDAFMHENKASEDEAGKIWQAFADGKPYQAPQGSSQFKPTKYFSMEEYIDGHSSIMFRAPREKVIRVLKKAGYDGIVYNNTSRNEVIAGADPKAYIVLDPTQAKSAFNRGAWDPKNPDPRYTTQEDKLAYEDALYANDYVSRRIGRKLTAKEKEVGRLAYGIKALNPADVKKAAKEMASQIPGDKSKAILIPIPGHTGDTAANVAIAEQIAEMTGAKIKDVLQRTAGPSQRDLRVSRKKTQTPGEIVTATGEKITRTKDVYFIDNVIASGATIRAARDAVGGGRGLVYAKSFSKGPKYTFAGPEAKGADKSLAFEAQQMRDAGKSRKEVWDKTGWYEIVPGSDVWSFEIDDTGASLKKATGTLDQALEHPTLFKEYPFLKTVKVEQPFGGGSKAHALYNPATKTIEAILDYDNGSIDQRQLAILLHEVQHAVQDYEGFAHGGHPDMFPMEQATKVMALWSELHDLYNRGIGKDLQAAKTAGDTKKIIQIGRENPTEYSTINDILNETQTTDIPAALKKLDERIKDLDPYGQYYRLTGEAQARLTQKRKDMTTEQRKAEAPWITLRYMMQEEGLIQPGQNPEDVLDSRYEGGAAMMAASESSAENNATFSLRTDPPPTRTVKAYKAFRMIDGKIYPMFVGSTAQGVANVTPLPMNEWLDAEAGGYHFMGKNGRQYVPTFNKRGGDNVALNTDDLKIQQELVDLGYISSIKTKSVKAVAYRPGWHGGELPFFPQGGKRMKEPVGPYKNMHEADTFLAEVDFDDSNSSALVKEYERTAERTKTGKINHTLSGLRKVPKGGSYQYHTNPLLKDRPELGKWLISGSMKIKRIVPAKEAEKILKAHGLPPQPWESPMYSTSSDRKDPMATLPKHVQGRMKKARGVDHTSFMDQAKQWFQKVKEQTSHFPELTRVQDKSKRAIFKEQLRQHQEIPTTSQFKAARAIDGYISGMTDQEYDLYSLRLILGDEIANLDDGARTGKNLPFGFKSENEIRESYRKINQMVDASPKVKEAIDARQEFQHQVAQRLVDHKILNKDVLKSKEYFHHQVLQYWNLKERAMKGLGTGSKDARSHWRPWMAKRKDSPLDYNTEYVEAELMALAQMIAQADTADSLKKIREESDIMPDLKQSAKQANEQALDAIYYRKARQGNWPVTKDGEPVDPLLPFKQKIAMSFSGLEKLAKDKDLSFDPGFEDLVEGLAKGNTSHPQLWQFLSNQIQKKHSGAMQAATIYKYIKARDRFIKDTLGKNFKTAENMIPEGYVSWEPKANAGWFKVNTIADRVLEQVLSGEKALQDDDVKQVLAKGRPQAWVIPEGLAATMDNFRPGVSDYALGRLSARIMTGWKQYILLNPLSFFRYNINNMSGDGDATLAFDPKIATYAKQSLKDLRKWMKFGKNEELNTAMDKGVIGSGFAVQEVEDTIQVLGVNRVVDEIMLGKNPRLVAKYWAFVKDISTWRENMLRLAAYRYFKDQHAKGVYETFGASKPSEIRALVQSGRAEDAAAKMARELLGDYGALSRHGEMLRRHVIPFWSWMEINLPRYVYLMRNLKHEGGSAGTGIRAAGALAKRGSMFALKASLLYGAISIWNLTMFPDEEDELGEAKRGQLMMILGRTKEGHIRTLRVEGAVSDALSWFGMEDLPGDIKDVYQGKANLTDKGEEMGKALVNRMVQGVRPDVKTAMELFAGKKAYPDVFTPRPIRDRVEHVLGTVKMQQPYQWAAGKPKKGDTASKQLFNDLLQVVTYTTEPGVQAYYDTRSRVYAWRDKHDIEGGGGVPTSRGNALYYYKQAMRFGDLKAADKYIRKYADLGGTEQGLKQSIRMAHPLSGISKQHRAAFLNDLTPGETERLKKAIKWHQATYLGRKQQ